MSRDIRQHWQEVRKLEASLPEFVWLAAARELPVVTQATAAVAARLLQRRSHRQATEEEVEAHLAAEQEANRAAREERMRRQGTSLVVVRGE